MSIARHPLIMFGTKPAAPIAFLLDTYTGAAAAYSLRQLKTGVTSVVKVRRTAGSPATADFTAAEVTDGTLAAWVGVGNDGFIDTEYDQSGNNNHRTQSTTSLQPQIVSNGVLLTVNGQPAALWNASGTSNLVCDASIISVRSVFSVLENTKTDTLTGGWVYGNTSVSDYNGGVNSNTWLWATGVADILNGDNRLNDIVTDLKVTDKNTSQVLLSMIHLSDIGRINQFSNDRGNVGRAWQGYRQLDIIYTTDQTSNRAAINTAINTLYGIY